MKENLTPKQSLVLNFIKKYMAENGFPPSIREICKGLDLSSTATVFTHMKKLEEKEYIKTSANKFRAIELLCENEYSIQDEKVVSVPLLGKVTAGNPITAIETPNEFFDIPANIIPKGKEVFTLHVSGDSMINAGIFDGDYVVVKRCKSANNGDIVVAMNENDEVTLKRFYKENGRIRLQPENDTMAPIYLNSCTILGIASSLYRKL